MRIKDSPKSNAEGSSKKEGKKKSNKQKSYNKPLITFKNQKVPGAAKTEKDNPKPSPAKNATDKEV